MKKIKCVIFDLDGTVGDTVPLCIKAFKKSIEPLINKNVSDEEIIATFGPSEEGTIISGERLKTHLEQLSDVNLEVKSATVWLFSEEE